MVFGLLASASIRLPLLPPRIYLTKIPRVFLIHGVERSADAAFLPVVLFSYGLSLLPVLLSTVKLSWNVFNAIFSGITATRRQSRVSIYLSAVVTRLYRNHHRVFTVLYPRPASKENRSG